MNSAQLSIIRSKLSRKVGEWDEAAMCNLSDDLIAQLNVYDGVLLGLKTPFTTLPDYMQQDRVFVVLIKGQRFVVNTEGYDYSRYVARLGPVDENND